MQSDTVYRFKLDDGSEVKVRRETPDDLPLMIDLFEHVSPDSRLDWTGDLPASTDHAAAVREATRLAELDRGGSVAWLAFADRPGRASVPVAGGRYTPSASGPAELSVVVRDDMQRQGIGSRLLYFVLDQARAEGIGEARTSFESGNEAAWQVLQYSPYHITWQPCGQQVEVMIHLQARTGSSASLN
jgi:GNAT superfamily N-acetyltransferase